MNAEVITRKYNDNVLTHYEQRLVRSEEICDCLNIGAARTRSSVSIRCTAYYGSHAPDQREDNENASKF